MKPTKLQEIDQCIFIIRGKAIMIDRDIAYLFGIPTKRINEMLKRNVNRFPDYYFFKLNNNEKSELVANCDRFSKLKHSSHPPIAFTEYGVSMLATLAKSEMAAQISINIIDAFVRMKHAENNGRFLSMEIHQLVQKTNKHEKEIEWLMQQFEQPNNKTQGIFFNNQIFDAYAFSSDLIKSAKKSVLLIDNYIDETTLLQLSKRNAGVSCVIYTERITPAIKLDLEKHNAQYSSIAIRILKNVHDRFLIIDNKELYHLGASLKDLGKRWFAFSRIDGFLDEVLARLN
jgi:phage regulator Rha-like protein